MDRETEDRTEEKKRTMSTGRAVRITLLNLLAMVVVFMRAKKKDYALAVLPLTLVPFAHIISGVISRFLDSLIFLSFTQIRVLIDLTAALFSCLLL